MGETSARGRLAAALRELQDASGLTYTQIENQANSQGLRLGRSKLSNWFKGTSVPADDPAFRLLVQLLESRARTRTGAAARGLSWWRTLQKAAAAERHTTGEPKQANPAPPVPPPAGTPHPGDGDKATRLLRFLPLDGPWLRWLEKAETMFRVPLAVSDVVCDAEHPVTADLPDYVDAELHDAHHALITALTALCFELNGMNDLSDEGPLVLEISHPGTSAERNEMNRQACQTRDDFLPAYRTMINLLNRKNLLPPPPPNPSAAPTQAGLASAPDNAPARQDAVAGRGTAAEPRPHALRVGQGLPNRAWEIRQAHQALVGQGVGDPTDEAWEHGATALQNFHHTEPGRPDWTLCLAPGRPAVAVAAPVWQAITTAGRASIGEDAFAAIGFPVPPADGRETWLIHAEAQELDLADGRWGAGCLKRTEHGGEWRWHPHPRLSIEQGRSATNWTSGQTPALRLRAVGTLPWADTNTLEITTQRRLDLAQKLPNSQLNDAMTLLFKRRAANLPSAQWRRTPAFNSSRSLSYTCTLTAPDGTPALQAAAILALPTTMESSVIVCAEVLIVDRHAWAALLQPGWDTYLSLQEAQAALLGAWETATELLPEAIGIPDLRWSAPPTTELRLSSERPEPNGVLPPLTQVLDLTPFGDGDDRTAMAVTITAPLRLSPDERRNLLRRALVHMGHEFGYIDAVPEALL